MPYKDPEKRKEYCENNKEYIKEYNKKYREANKEHIKEYKKQYREANKAHIKEYKKEYYQTDKGKKSFIIGMWKYTGLIHDDYEALYEHYINTWECDNCAIALVTGNTAPNFRCMDHDHKTKKFRNILCNFCNLERGKDDNSNK